MYRLTRMEVTLGCLVASMTLGATLLDWFQPNRASPRLSPLELTARHLEEAIQQSDQDSPAGSSWRGIRLVLQPAGNDPDNSKNHILIDRQGNCSLTDSFHTRATLNGQPGVVRIALIVPAATGEVTAGQNRTAEKLVRILRQQCRIPEERIERERGLAAPFESPFKTSKRRPALQTSSLNR